MQLCSDQFSLQCSTVACKATNDVTSVTCKAVFPYLRCYVHCTVKYCKYEKCYEDSRYVTVTFLKLYPTQPTGSCFIVIPVHSRKITSFLRQSLVRCRQNTSTSHSWKLLYTINPGVDFLPVSRTMRSLHCIGAGCLYCLSAMYSCLIFEELVVVGGGWCLRLHPSCPTISSIQYPDVTSSWGDTVLQVYFLFRLSCLDAWSSIPCSK